MADKDSWWQDDSRNSSDSTTNPFSPRTTQNDGSLFSPKSVNEGFKPRIETAEKQNKINRKTP
ncbi:hypothetical protein A9485_05725 [Bacillus cereus]|uniref:hypothetical protein n=1 Tax=Bacillus cereus group TaxID=86661 RepID=UPI0008FDA32F|nr:hypothetical protein [Bacillus cereus]OJD94354.1 hypothetical protein A9485_05725 [Bacillus cereus]